MNFRRYVLPSLLVVALAAGLAWAQNINKAIQLSQDPTGAIGVDTNNNVYFPGHVLTVGPGAPVITSCGTSPTITGTDTMGNVTAGTAAPSGCVITFSRAYLATPYCIVSAQNPGTSPLAYSASTTAITLTGGVSSTIFNYVCSGSR